MTNNTREGWTTADSLALYNVQAWGEGYFTINDKGHLVVTVQGEEGTGVDLLDLIHGFQRRGLDLPVLIRFSDILASRVRCLHDSFNKAIEEYGLRNRYQAVFPIKVNQQRHVVEEIIQYGRPYHLGLEAGSKPELLVALALLEDPDAFIICNGYKDEEYIEAALLAQKLGRTPMLVIDRRKEIDLILDVSTRLGVRPHIGMRAKLISRGAGKWMGSTGDRSKFGLTAMELVEVVQQLKSARMLDCLELLHYHIGSQITAIRAIKEALQEASRIFVELQLMGAGLRCIDVGGGLAVDYDGSSSDFHSSANYSLQEYANDVVCAIVDACNDKDIPHPTILSESGRALVSHSSVLVFDVLGVDRIINGPDPTPASGDEHQVLASMREVLLALTDVNFQESYHDALQCREEATSLFSLGYLDLEGRALMEQLFRAFLSKLLALLKEMDQVPDEFTDLEEKLSDTYFCNFSVFQSVPDHWVLKQLFPTLPIHRLDEEPTRRGILADLTCDSDGRVDRFVGLGEEKKMLELHEIHNGQPYYLGMFLVGAYQEILGDLHNLFGDTNAVHVSLVGTTFRIEHLVRGDTVSEVLEYVQYDPPGLLSRFMASAENALHEGRLTLEESARLLKTYENGLNKHMYLQRSPEPGQA